MFFTSILLFTIVSPVLPTPNERWPRCVTGASLVGVNLKDAESQGCCDEFSCYKNVPNDQSVFNSIKLPLKYSITGARSYGVPKSSVHQKQKQQDGASCCRTQTSIMFPLSGFSATTGKRVSIIQLENLRQPVVQERCIESSCRIIRGNCTQLYTPLSLYVLDASLRRAMHDFVIVENGCQCRTSYRPSFDGHPEGETGIDDSAKQAYEFISGQSFPEKHDVPFTNGKSKEEKLVDTKEIIAAEEEFLVSCGSSSNSVTEDNLVKHEDSTALDDEVALPAETLFPGDNLNPLLISAGDFDPILHTIKRIFLRPPTSIVHHATLLQHRRLLLSSSN